MLMKMIKMKKRRRRKRRKRRLNKYYQNLCKGHHSKLMGYLYVIAESKKKKVKIASLFFCFSKLTFSLLFLDSFDWFFDMELNTINKLLVREFLFWIYQIHFEKVYEYWFVVHQVQMNEEESDMLNYYL